MTFIPALPSSAARMPPAAPTPTMTTSVFSVAMAHALLWALDQRSGLFLIAADDLFHLVLDELDPRPLVRPPPIVGQARRRQAPGVAHVRIEVDGLVGVGQVLGLPGDRRVTREIFREEVAIGGAPARDAGRRVHVHGGADRAAFQAGRTGRDLGAADEAQAAMVEVVGIEVVERMLLRARP